MTDERLSKVAELRTNIDALGFTSKLGASNEKGPTQVWIYKNNKLIAKVSFSLAARVNTMFNGVGRHEKDLLALLTRFSLSL